MKKYVSFIIINLIFIFSIPLISYAEENKSIDLAKDAKSSILIEQDTGKILFEKDAHEQLPPASLTKVMTLLIVMEELDKGTLTLDETVRVSERAASMGGSQVFLAAGEEITVEDLLKSIAIASGNDASVAIAERISGSEEAFVQRMNEKAEELQLKNTKFQNSSGLPAKNQYTSAYDLAIMSQELLTYETITDYTSIYEDYLRKGEENEFWLVNTNKLVRFYDGVDGLKTGYTSEAKYGLAATAKRDNFRVIAVVMGADTVKLRNGMVSSMLDYSFNQYEHELLFHKNDVITTIEQLKAEKQQIPVITEQPIAIVTKRNEDKNDLKTRINIQEDLTLPLTKGEQIGSFQIKKGNDIILETPLTVKEDVNKASYTTFLKRTIKNMLKIQ
ncbi:MAG TPA: D-alanyl-D-alanine carboxypeptidase family protein [Bacillota bacterium]|nr:D-alanyl-D-alanine carboxypeptidase family protein [Bacillota bacterium]